MLKLNDTVLETVSGGYGSSWSFKSTTINKNIANIQITKNFVLDGAIMVQVTQANGNIS